MKLRALDIRAVPAAIPPGALVRIIKSTISEGW